MKKLFKLPLLMAFAITLVSCFKPDPSSADDMNMLEGYWEIVHIDEHDTWHYIRQDGTKTEDQHYDFSGNITCNDGNESYAVLHFTPTYITLIATDCKDDMEMIGLPLPYSYSDKKLSGPAFRGDFCDYITVEELDEDKLVLYMEDIGTEMYDLEDYFGEDYDPTTIPVDYSIGEYSNYRSRMTYRRIQ